VSYGRGGLLVALAWASLAAGAALPALATAAAQPTVPAQQAKRPIPRPAAVRSAAHYLAGREGRKAFAVIDSRGRLAGVHLHEHFHSASVVKSMLLATYLRMLASKKRGLDDTARGLLYPMIHSSDNDAASAVLAIVGEQRLDRLARAARMRDYEPGGSTWGFTEVSAADLARFFYRLGALIPPRFLAYARWLLSNIEPSESWGIPAVARPRYRVFFKGGWLPEVEGLVNQVARLEGHGSKLAIAVLSTGDPSMAYGERTIEGVTARLLAGSR
jgi:Beta-lactamase enzyme family